MSSSGSLVWPDLTEWSSRFCARGLLQSLLRRNSDLLLKLLPCFGKTLGWASYRKYHTIHSTFAIYLLQTLWSHRLPALVGQSATADIGLPEPLLFYSVYSSSYTKDFAVTSTKCEPHFLYLTAEKESGNTPIREWFTASPVELALQAVITAHYPLVLQHYLTLAKYTSTN